MRLFGALQPEGSEGQNDETAEGGRSRRGGPKRKVAPGHDLKPDWIPILKERQRCSGPPWEFRVAPDSGRWAVDTAFSSMSS